jgi:Rap1a immunity proteins
MGLCMSKISPNSMGWTAATWCRIFPCLAALGGAGLLFAADAPEAFTGQEMLGYCKNLELEQKQDFDRGICVGFLDGFIAGHQVAENYHAFHHRDEKIDTIIGRLCIPPKTTRGQMAKMLVRYLEQFPDKLKSPAGNLLEEAIQEAHPCPEKVPPKPN